MPQATCRIYLCIEVKKTEQPFIFFSNPISRYESGSGYGILHWKNRMDRFILSYDDIESMRPLRGLPRLSRSYISFKDSKEQQIKGGILSAFKGAVHLSETTENSYSSVSHDINFFIPLVVVDGPIYECYFEGVSSELIASQVDALVYMQNYLSDSYGDLASRVVIVTMGALDHLLNEYNQWGERIVSIMKDKRKYYQGK